MSDGHHWWMPRASIVHCRSSSRRQSRLLLNRAALTDLGEPAALALRWDGPSACILLWPASGAGREERMVSANHGGGQVALGGFARRHGLAFADSKLRFEQIGPGIWRVGPVELRQALRAQGVA